MPRASSKGICEFCKGTFGKQGMNKHLQTCTQRPAMPPKADLYHLLVEGQHATRYWLHLNVRADAKLRDLDQCLRDIWLECCGHLSAFEIHGRRYSVSPLAEFDERNMNARLSEVLAPDVKFTHEYDFGTTTELVLKVVAAERGDSGKRPIQLLARNTPPDIPCGVCGKPSTITCAECNWEPTGWLCAEHASEHEHDEEMFLPVVNSPRVGQCGYTG
jgi:hypothetical protein